MSWPVSNIIFCSYAISPPAGHAWSRTVTVPGGPLTRVAGTDVSIPCHVRDYEGPVEQNFEWTFSPSAGSSLEIISTFDPKFTDSMYTERVSAGGVRLQRVGHNAVQLHIQSLSPSDEGEYTCSTPSTDATISGNYKDQVGVKVIPDTLTVRRTKGRSAGARVVPEGGSFHLQCQAESGDASEHTHLSLTWLWQGSQGLATPVLTLSHLGRFQPGPGYEERYDSGAVRLDTVGADGYRLVVEDAQTSDTGDYSCTAATWVQGPQGWEQIQQKNISVSSIEVRPRDVNVTVSVNVTSVTVGDPLALSCHVQQDSTAPGFTRVRWFVSRDKESQELPWGQDPDPTQTDGTNHLLELPHVWDSGEYTCQAMVWVAHRNATWYLVAQKASKPIKVSVNSVGPELGVSLNASFVPQFSEERTELVCEVSGPDGAHVSVSWYHTSVQESDSPMPPPDLVGALDHDWTLREGERYWQRIERGEIVFSRRNPQIFVLRFLWTSDKDRGRYHCEATVWERQQNKSWAEIRTVPSNPFSVTWDAAEPSLAVSATVTRVAAATGGTFEMECAVTARNIPSPRYSVQVKLIQSAPSPSTVAPSLLRGHADGVTPGGLRAFGKAVLEKVQERLYRFRLYQSQAQDSGSYQCSVTAWTQGGSGAWREVKNQTSNQVNLQFQGTDNTAFDVSWFSQRPGKEPAFLAAVDRSAQVRQSRRNSSSDVAIERLSAMEFRLRIYGCEEEDIGGHYCTVTPWVQTVQGDWSSQESVTSNVVSLAVRMDLLNAFKYPLLIGVGLALLIGLLSGLIGYCSSRHCCRAQPVQQTRKEHRRLMSMELD
ncbi:hypothetical protein GDO86_019703 [Hymenochirus boettgeri]|uniref:Ig-like domain-containing protein n=1 Tax=Hymenochirus boettgeri TaxID=247094 RepID=A0A8T2IIP3_9PIPI|nr:hypothetical protein GDO86_019703 [Hymenochirus boettgeri]